MLNDTSSNSTIFSANYIKGAKKVTLNTNTYSQCYISAFGGVWRFEDTQTVDEVDSEYYDNLAIYGGAISASNSSVNFNKTSFKKHTASIGGVFHIEKEAKLYTYLCDI